MSGQLINYGLRLHHSAKLFNKFVFIDMLIQVSKNTIEKFGLSKTVQCFRAIWFSSLQTSNLPYADDNAV
jgi:hypothetical protein